MGSRIEEDGLKKGPWTPEEDQKLVDCIQKHGHGNWKALPKLAGLNRCGKSCRLRWTNYLRPDVKRGAFSDEEERVIIDLHEKLGNKWSAIAGYLPGRTDNEIKNFWNTRLKKKLLWNGIDPDTHMPRTHFDTFLSGLPQLLSCNDTTNLTCANASQVYAARLAKTLLIGNILQLLSTGHSPPLPIETFSPSLESALVMNRPPWDSSMMGLQSGFKDVARPVFQSSMGINGVVGENSSELGETSIMYTNYAVPDLVSASPNCFISPTEFPNPQSTFDALGDLTDDEARNRYWKQLLDQASQSP